MPTDPKADPADASAPPRWDSPRAELIRRVPGGPALVYGPVRIPLPDGQVVTSNRVVVAVCRCRRSGIYPLCDTSHRSIGHDRPAQAGSADEG